MRTVLGLGIHDLVLESQVELIAAPERAAHTNRRAAIVAAGERLRSHISKIEHLREAALTDEGRRELVALIERNGCTVTRADAFASSPQVCIGTALVAARSLT